MSLVSFSNVTKYFSLDLILDHVSFNINKGERVALVGPNGTGKTTLLKLILKEEFPTLVEKENKPGDISILNGTKIGYLNQNAITNLDNTVLEELKLSFSDVYKEIDKFNYIASSLAYKADEKTLEEYNKLLEHLNSINAFNLNNKIEGYITKFHFPLSILDSKIRSLSGGERMKIAFIKLLLVDYDLLLLDEPTNHLDISTIEWLEQYLKDYKGTILFISHDRYFLETLANKILDLDNHKITTYNMDYNSYLKEKEINYQNELRQFNKEEEEMAKLKRFIEFYMPKPRFVGRAKDRVHKLEKLEASHIEKPTQENKNIKFKIDGSNLKNKGLLDFKNVSAGYDHSLFPDFNFTLYGKDRLAVIGDNGIGKTTLIKSIMQEIPCFCGEIKQLRKLKIGYIKQNDHNFNPKDTCLDYLENLYPTKLERELRTALGRFLFKKEDVFKTCSLLSNGEKMRLILCGVSLSSYDILILDEPTNHLDLVTKECLLDSLKFYGGAIIFISHDRYFINSLATHILLLDETRTIVFDGNYDELKSQLEEDKKDAKISEVKPKNEVKKQSKNKLSNNRLNEYKKRASIIENRLLEIDDFLSEEFEDYNEINKLTDEKNNLEIEYMEILEIIEEND